jgi:hypothetical protein
MPEGATNGWRGHGSGLRVQTFRLGFLPCDLRGLSAWFVQLAGRMDSLHSQLPFKTP